MRPNYSSFFTPLILILAILPLFFNFIDTNINRFYLPTFRILALLATIIVIHIINRNQKKEFKSYATVLYISFTLLALKELLMFINLYYSLSAISIMEFVLTICGYVSLYVLLVIRIRQLRQFIPRQMRIVAMALTAVGTAIASPVHITYYQKLMETNNTIEIVFSAILLLIYLDVFTLSVSLLYLNRKTKSSFFWITLVGGLFLFLGGDVFYRYSISLESYIYGTYPDTIFNLAYSVFLIGMIFLSQRQDDVTSVLEVIEERKHYQNLYLELNNLATDLLNVTSLFHHDLINDLSFIQSSLDIYQDTKKTKMLDNIQKRLDTVAQKIRNLNTSSDVLKSLRTQSIEVNSISDVVLSFDNVSYIPATENVKIEFSNLLSSILINLIQNSFQHGGNGILVQVETTFDEQSVFIKVKDNGIGISDEDKKKVFKKEFRKSDKGVGGIGLFLIENLVQRFEGKIYFEDNIPQGTIVTVELPRCD